MKQAPTRTQRALLAHKAPATPSRAVAELPLVVVDAHVHIYGCFDLGRFLSSAARNFRAEARRQGSGDRVFSFLLLSESAGYDWFHALAGMGKICGAPNLSTWKIVPTRERESLDLRDKDGNVLLVVAGRQIVTRENLEVLALATDRNFADGKPIQQIVHEVRLSGGIAVIPWGFGKWVGRRGRILRSYLELSAPAGLFLGDNSARPAILPRPFHFELAERLGIRILPGSDPLPFSSEEWRPGSFGFTVRAAVDPERPATSLRGALGNPNVNPEPYGRHETITRFLRNQLAMQAAKRWPPLRAKW